MPSENQTQNSLALLREYCAPDTTPERVRELERLLMDRLARRPERRERMREPGED